MLFAYGSLMCTKQPTLQQRSYTMDARQSYMSRITPDPDSTILFRM